MIGEKNTLRLFDSMERELRDFTPLEEGRVKMYSCGPTVYNYAHIGNLRAYIFVDSLRRVLQWKGYDVVHVMNITDVGHLTDDADEGDDKMEMAAAREKKTIWDIAAYYTDHFKADLESLNIQPPSVWSTATDHIMEMIDWARIIQENGYAYELEDGLYFDTGKLPEYGKLGRLDLEGMEAGARVDMVEGKRNLSDFAIWRKSPDDAQRLMEWDSPWGKGAPGWHLECSCMSHKYLGMDFDIHTGGVDHRTVHHCNEIAQNQAYLGNEKKTGARWWMHNEFLTLGEDAKMSKSTGDFLRLKTILDQGVHPLAYRFFALQAGYRKQLRFSIDSCLASARGLQRFLKYVKGLIAEVSDSELRWVAEMKFSRGASFKGTRQMVEARLGDSAKDWLNKFDESISDDLDIAAGLAMTLNISDLDAPASDKVNLIALVDLVLGLRLLETEPNDIVVVDEDKIGADEIEALIEERKQARLNKDYGRSDEIRDDLANRGVRIMDGPEGTTWEYTL